MDRQVKDKLCKWLDQEIEKIANLPSPNDVNLANLYKLIEAKKGILKIEMLEGEAYENYPMDGYSNRGNSYYGGNYYSNRGYSRNGNSYDGRMNGNSNHYPNEPIYAGGYSMDSMDSHGHLEEAMRNARSDQERDAIRQVMSKLYN